MDTGYRPSGGSAVTISVTKVPDGRPALAIWKGGIESAAYCAVGLGLTEVTVSPTKSNRAVLPDGHASAPPNGRREILVKPVVLLQNDWRRSRSRQQRDCRQVAIDLYLVRVGVHHGVPRGCDGREQLLWQKIRVLDWPFLRRSRGDGHARHEIV